MATIVPSMNEQDLAILQLQRGSTYRRDNARGSMRLAAPLSDESEPGTTRVTHNLDTDKQLPTHLWSERDYAQYKKAGKAPSSAPASTRTVVNMTEVTVFQEETHARSPANMDNAQSEAVPVRVQVSPVLTFA